ncbi:MAG: class I SAM-dependent methyltransferase [Jatrophihabitans sp.]|uniref:class I SAM-dependent methyltransferase n=1 Tax=Jatrophihabitans sp. TaxID=1932789 RepID=UPI003F819F6D
MTLHLDRGRAESFGSVAADYDRYRPGYPDALIDELAALRPRQVLDVACGTGKAARQLAARGLDVLGLEIDARMAEVARGHGIPVEVGAFETWDAAGRTFDLITVAQAWHWIQPEAGIARAVELLRPGGSLAVFWNHDETDDDDEAVPALAEAYRRHAPGLGLQAGSHRKHRTEPTHVQRLRDRGRFASVVTRDHPWQRTYTAAEWVGYVATHSDHLALPAEQQQRLYAAIGEAVESIGGTLTLRGGTYLILATRP